MPKAPAKLSSEQLQRLADQFKALGHPHRLAIFLRLCEQCGTACARDEEAYSACVGELAEGLDLAPSTLSHHLRELRLAGLINTRRNGQMVECCADLANIKGVRDFIAGRCC